MNKKELLARAEELLADIRERQAVLQKVDAAANKELTAVRDRYTPLIRETKESLEACERELTGLAKRHREAIFGDRDRVDLDSGALLYGRTEVVRRARAVTVELLDQLQYQDGVLVVRSVNWDVIETWKDERLAAIGTERRPRENFDYELKQEEKVHG